jgi:hypothetical protein
MSINPTGDIEITRSTLDAGAIGNQPENVWAVAEEKIKAKRSPRGGRGRSRGRSKDGNPKPVPPAVGFALQRRADRIREVADEYNRIFTRLKSDRDRKVAMMGRAAAIWQPKDVNNRTVRFAPAGTTTMLYIEPVYQPSDGQLQFDPANKNEDRGRIVRFDLLRVAAKLDPVTQTVAYSSGRLVDLMVQPDAKERHKDQFTQWYRTMVSALKLVKDLINSCVDQPNDGELVLVEETDDTTPSKTLQQPRVLPRLVAGFHTKPVFDPNNVAPALAGDLAAAAEYFETLIIEPMQDGNNTQMFFVPLGFYNKWPLPTSIYGVKESNIYEDFEKVFHVVENGDVEHLVPASTILWSTTTRDEAMFNMTVEGVPTTLDLRPWDYEDDATADLGAESETAVTAETMLVEQVN